MLQQPCFICSKDISASERTFYRSGQYSLEDLVSKDSCFERFVFCNGYSYISSGFNRLWFTGAYPVLYDAGRSTVIQPVFSSDVAEGIARLLRHPTSPGHTFEFVG